MRNCVLGIQSALVVMVLVGLLACLTSAGTKKPQVTWLQSQVPSVELSVTDKTGILHSYQAHFRVTAPDTWCVATKNSEEGIEFPD